ncbi:MAG: histidine kinase dimerization/phospho-acceptor domain-containing protein [Gallionella sp.]|nr:histidine kinase dimerization/phospho-acceptor domain-containing protein [Gallionella sp.]MDD4947270.1 histidine kinase dimerization/phospho-acceptor domain-containing protein [Gallionella sp.]MDD5612329.1 histidine kinase dimerization/phospho-acceptor domain-containing protein [Gallionella sp.]
MNARTDAVDPVSAEFWRSLSVFNLYRLVLVAFIVLIALTLDVHMLFGEARGRLFLMSGVLYALVIWVSIYLLRVGRLALSWQLGVQVCGDIVALILLAHASGGIQSNVGLLLMVTLAVAGSVSRGKITLFYAALASIAALLEHSYTVLYNEGQVAQYVQVGLSNLAYFAVAGLAHKLAQYVQESQRLAQRRARDLVGMSEANRLVMRDMQDGVLVVDEHGTIMQMNPCAARLLHTPATTSYRLAESFPLLNEQFIYWKAGDFNASDTLKLDGGLQARLRFVAVERGTAHGAVIFLEDMQHLQAEAQQIKLAALGRLTANLAHEVRNPLSAISYATELLQEEPGNAKQWRLLHLIQENTQRINRIIQDVMQLNRRDRLQAESFDLFARLQVFVEEFNQIERINPGVLMLQNEQADQVVRATFDPGHWRQVLWNLCRNALRYSLRKPGSLLLSMGVDHGRPFLDVLDDGPGVAEENRAKLFEPFFTTAEAGTGLGLFVARELCEANGALLEYHDRYDVSDGQCFGACFRIIFGGNSGDNPE